MESWHEQRSKDSETVDHVNTGLDRMGHEVRRTKYGIRSMETEYGAWECIWIIKIEVENGVWENI